MKQKISAVAAIAVFGWFFAFQHPYGDPAEKTLARGIIGPFALKDTCEAAKLEVQTAMEQLGVQGQIGPCVERHEA
jgi:hypothetical protein